MQTEHSYWYANVYCLRISQPQFPVHIYEIRGLCRAEYPHFTIFPPHFNQKYWLWGRFLTFWSSERWIMDWWSIVQTFSHCTQEVNLQEFQKVEISWKTNFLCKDHRSLLLEHKRIIPICKKRFSFLYMWSVPPSILLSYVHSDWRLELEVHRLLIKLQDLLKLSVTTHIWSETSQYARDLVSY